MLGIENSALYFCHYRTKYSPSNTHPGASVSEITNPEQYFDMENYLIENSHYIFILNLQQ